MGSVDVSDPYVIQDPDSSDSEHEHIKSSSSRKRVKVFESSYFGALSHSGFEQSDSEIGRAHV